MHLPKLNVQAENHILHLLHSRQPETTQHLEKGTAEIFAHSDGRDKNRPTVSTAEESTPQKKSALVNQLNWI